jgi:hypothetical protein
MTSLVWIFLFPNMKISEISESPLPQVPSSPGAWAAVNLAYNWEEHLLFCFRVTLYLSALGTWRAAQVGLELGLGKI